MGTTPNFAFPYPASSDAADGPTQIQALATALDTRRQTDRQTAAFLLQDTTQTLTTAGTVYMISFDTEPYDNGGGHSNITNNSRWTVPAGRGGTYMIQGGWGTNTTSAILTAAIYKNGAEIGGSANRMAGRSGVGDTLAVSSRLVVVVLVAGDYIELAATSSAASTATHMGAGTRPSLSIIRLVD